MKKLQKHLKKIVQYNNLVLLLSAREKVLNGFKSRLFPIKSLDKGPIRVPTPTLATEPKVAKERAEEPEVVKRPATEPETRSRNRTNKSSKCNKSKI